MQSIHPTGDDHARQLHIVRAELERLIARLDEMLAGSDKAPNDEAVGTASASSGGAPRLAQGAAPQRDLFLPTDRFQ